MACPIIKFVSVSVPLLLFAELSLANDMFFLSEAGVVASSTMDKQ